MRFLVLLVCIIGQANGQSESSHFCGGSLSFVFINQTNVHVRSLLGWDLGYGPCGPGCGRSSVGASSTDTRLTVLQTRGNESLGIWKKEHKGDHILHYVNDVFEGRIAEVNEHLGWILESGGFNVILDPNIDTIDIKFTGNYWKEVNKIQAKDEEINKVPYHLQIKISGGIRNDTNRPNNGPIALFKPVYSILLNEVTEISLVTTDPDGDMVFCGKAQFSELGGLDQMPNVEVHKKNCSIMIDASVSAGYTDGGTVVVLVHATDMNDKPITFSTQPDLTIAPFQKPLSNIPVQFQVRTVKELTDPTFVSPTPEDRTKFEVYVGSQLQIKLFARPHSSSTARIESIDVMCVERMNLPMTPLAPDPSGDPSRKNVHFTVLTWDTTLEDVGTFIIQAVPMDTNGTDGQERNFIAIIKELKLEKAQQAQTDDLHPLKGNFTCFRNNTCTFPLMWSKGQTITDLEFVNATSPDVKVGSIKQDGGVYKSQFTMQGANPGKQDVCLRIFGSSSSVITCVTVTVITPDPCHLQPCEHNGHCSSHDDTFTCSCGLGYTGTHCESKIDFCASDPCKNGGRCYSHGIRILCVCIPPWKGDTCETAPDSTPKAQTTKAATTVTETPTTTIDTSTSTPTEPTTPTTKATTRTTEMTTSEETTSTTKTTISTSTEPITTETPSSASSGPKTSTTQATTSTIETPTSTSSAPTTSTTQATTTVTETTTTTTETSTSIPTEPTTPTSKATTSTKEMTHSEETTSTTKTTTSTSTEPRTSTTQATTSTTETPTSTSTEPTKSTTKTTTSTTPTSKATTSTKEITHSEETTSTTKTTTSTSTEPRTSTTQATTSTTETPTSTSTEPTKSTTKTTTSTTPTSKATTSTKEMTHSEETTSTTKTTTSTSTEPRTSTTQATTSTTETFIPTSTEPTTSTIKETTSTTETPTSTSTTKETTSTTEKPTPTSTAPTTSTTTETTSTTELNIPQETSTKSEAARSKSTEPSTMETPPSKSKEPTTSMTKSTTSTTELNIPEETSISTESATMETPPSASQEPTTSMTKSTTSTTELNIPQETSTKSEAARSKSTEPSTKETPPSESKEPTTSMTKSTTSTTELNIPQETSISTESATLETPPSASKEPTTLMTKSTTTATETLTLTSKEPTTATKTATKTSYSATASLSSTSTSTPASTQGTCISAPRHKVEQAAAEKKLRCSCTHPHTKKTVHVVTPTASTKELAAATGAGFGAGSVAILFSGLVYVLVKKYKARAKSRSLGSPQTIPGSRSGSQAYSESPNYSLEEKEVQSSHHNVDEF